MFCHQDAEGRSPLHIAISNQHPTIISLIMSHPLLDLTLRDKSGLTPFATALTVKNNKAAQAILDREPRAAEQVCVYRRFRTRKALSPQALFNDSTILALI